MAKTPAAPAPKPATAPHALPPCGGAWVLVDGVLQPETPPEPATRTAADTPV